MPEMLPKNVNVALSGETIQKLDAMCMKRGLNRQEIIHKMIDESYERAQKEDKAKG